MIVRVQEDGACRLIAHDDLRAFHAELESLAPETPECGVWDAAKAHIWVDVAWLQKTGPADEAWHAELANMIAFAATRGWRDDHGRIRAHIEAAGGAVEPCAPCGNQGE